LANKTNGRLAKGRATRHSQMYARVIRAAVGASWKDGDPVTVKQLAALARLAYKRGWMTRNARDEYESALKATG
jgi:hypothetical protein